MKSARRTRDLFAWCTIHSLWMIALTLWIHRLPHTTDEEMKLIQWTSAWKRIYLKDELPSSDRFLFINVAWEKMFVPKTDDQGFVIGNDVITNRKRLAELLGLINQKPDNHKFIIFDVRFEEKFSKNKLHELEVGAKFDSLEHYDSLLQVELIRTKRYLVSYHADAEGNFRLPVFQAFAGLSDYETTNGTVVKFSSVQNDTARTTPLLVHQAIHQSSYTKGFLFDLMDRKPVLTSFILDHRIVLHPQDFSTNQYYHHAYLSEVLSMPPALLHELIKDRIVIVGDFEDKDIHDTIYGSMPGPVILLNAFLALENHDNRLSLGFIVLLFIGYGVISLRCFSQVNFVENLIERLPFPSDAKKLLATFADYMILFILLSLASYFLFNIHLTILLFAVYMQMIEWVIAFFSRRQNLSLQATPKQV